ncbi:protein FAM216A [Labrus mixtus]|uniref:protein FAM216A n=1 Tax=Labrus mixtus TaxID=508554 RepID=UPI0029C0A257|nr:protein FAM216A [Labrus mixtus]
MTAGPFLKHTALTPAQKEYLYTVAASYSTAHVRDLINQHYMNVLHRCIPTGHDPERDDLVVPSSVNLPGTEGRSKHPSGVFSPTKHKEKIQTGARNPGKSSLSNTPSRQTRDHMRLRGRVKLSQKQEEEEEEEEEEDSLSECLSPLSVGERDDDTSSDL